VKGVLTRRLDETDALLDEDRDGPLRSDHGGQLQPEVVALVGFGDGVPGFGSRLLEEKKETKRRRLV